MNTYRTLDSQTEGPDATGPTRDHAKTTAMEPVYRQEWSYNIKPGRMPVSLQAKARPQTVATPISGLSPGRLPILVRNSNINPAATGSGQMNSQWRVSDPYWGTQQGQAELAGMGDSAAPTVAAPTQSVTPILLSIAAVIGIVGFWVFNKAE